MKLLHKELVVFPKRVRDIPVRYIKGTKKPISVKKLDTEMRTKLGDVSKSTWVIFASTCRDSSGKQEQQPHDSSFSCIGDSGIGVGRRVTDAWYLDES